MDHRLYFVLGDLSASVISGALVGWLIWLLTPSGWNMWLVMTATMLLGMLFSAPLFLLFSTLFGAMEVMLPLMLSGMVAGMVVGMHATMASISSGLALLEGAVCGLTCIIAVWVMNSHMRGPRTLPTPGTLPHD